MGQRRTRAIRRDGRRTHGRRIASMRKNRSIARLTRRWAGCCLAAVCAASCAGPVLVSDRSGPAHPALHHVLVIAIQLEPRQRRIYEDALAAGLAARGLEAAPSYRTFPQGAPDSLGLVRAGGDSADGGEEVWVSGIHVNGPDV